jgi:hypothetical protein
MLVQRFVLNVQQDKQVMMIIQLVFFVQQEQVHQDQQVALIVPVDTLRHLQEACVFLVNQEVQTIQLVLHV